MNKKHAQQHHSKAHTDDGLHIYGKHVVDRALEQYPSAILRVWLDPKFSDDRLVAKVRRVGCTVSALEERRLPGEVSCDSNHQGIIAMLDQKSMVQPYATYVRSVSIAKESCFLVLSEIQDPQNVGAMIRSAAAFGVQAVLLPKHRQAPLNGTVAKVSAGMMFAVPLVSVGNLNTTLADLQQRGVKTYGLAGGEGDNIYETDVTGACAFVVGNEATGLRQQTRKMCDSLLQIPIHPRCESLNASAAVTASLAIRGQQLTNR